MGLEKPLVSVYMPAIRPQWWMRMYESLLDNTKVRFELLFVGHVQPNYILPDNCYHINSPVKPAQCAEIGFRNCRGEFCMNIADDIVFGDRCLDILYEKFMFLHNDMLVVSCIHHAGGKPLPKEMNTFFPNNPGTPINPIAGLYKTSVYKSLGPRDKGFVCTYSDSDMAFRLYERGGVSVICDEAHVHEVNPPDTRHDSGLNWIGKDCDWPLMLDLWFKNRSTHYLGKRARPIDPFVEPNLMLTSQGPKGKWV